MSRKWFLSRYFITVGLLANITLLALLFFAWLMLDRSPAMAAYALGDYLQSRPERPVASLGSQLKALFPPETHSPPSASFIPDFSANRDASFVWQTYQQGLPVEGRLGRFSMGDAQRIVPVSSEQEFLEAIRDAQAGDLISLQAGVYRFDGRSISVRRPGAADRPIYVRAERLGEATLKFNLLEGLYVRAPYWVFENLQIKGDCAKDGRCEHAFHVVAGANGFVLRNSILEDFNAALKVNGGKAEDVVKYPDNGLVEYNIFRNTRRRDTAKPVTLLNINSVNNWVVRGNLISDFAKMGSDRISYGAFMKGNGHHGVFERNLIYCEQQLSRDDGVRIGLSFGGGGTAAAYCRDDRCDVEHSGGVMRNNIILNCSADVGIYLNKAADTKIYNNLLHNSLGIDVRFAASSADIRNNIVSGRIKARDGGQVYADNNWLEQNCFNPHGLDCAFNRIFSDLLAGDLRLKTLDNPVWGKGTLLVDGVTQDFCGNHRGGQAMDIGPIEYQQGLTCLKPQ